jgi:hypothetical protein
MHGEEEARKGVEEARQAVIKACADLSEAEMFLDAFKSHERSAVSAAAARAASTGDIKNSHASNIREDVQPSKVIHTDYAPDEYAESQLLEAASALQKAALVLGAHLIRHWFDEKLLARAQGDLMQIQVQMLAKLQRLNARTINDLSASQGDDHGRVAVGDVEDELVNVRAAHRERLVEASAAAGAECEGDFDSEAPLGVVGDCVDCNGGGPDVA